MNHENKRPLATLETVAKLPSCKTQKASSAINPNSDRESDLKLVVAFDGFSNRNRVRYFLQGLAEKFSKIFTVIPRLLKIEKFAKPISGENQPREPAAVDLIVVVADEQADLHDLAEECMRRWKLTSGAEGRRLLALFSSCHEANDRWNQTQSPFHQAPCRTGVRFDPQITQMPRMVFRAVEATPPALRQSDECSGKLRNPCDTDLSLNSLLRYAASGETPVDSQRTVVSNAIIEVMRSRQRKTCRSTALLSNSRCMRSPGTNRIRNSSIL
jgi:hypothetical protein